MDTITTRRPRTRVSAATLEFSNEQPGLWHTSFFFFFGITFGVRVLAMFAPMSSFGFSMSMISYQSHGSNIVRRRNSAMI